MHHFEGEHAKIVLERGHISGYGPDLLPLGIRQSLSFLRLTVLVNTNQTVNGQVVCIVSSAIIIITGGKYS